MNVVPSPPTHALLASSLILGGWEEKDGKNTCVHAAATRKKNVFRKLYLLNFTTKKKITCMYICLLVQSAIRFFAENLFLVPLFHNDKLFFTHDHDASMGKNGSICCARFNFLSRMFVIVVR